MAKNKKKVVDLKPTSITDKELQTVQELVNLVQKGELQIGSLEVKKHGLLHQVVAIQEQLGQVQKNFEETYGKVNINIQNGEIDYNVEADKKN